MKLFAITVISLLVFTVTAPATTFAVTGNDDSGSRLPTTTSGNDDSLPPANSSGTTTGGTTTTTDFSIQPPEGLSGITSINALIRRIISWAAGIAGAIAVLMIVYGGYQYVISGASPDLRKKASSTLLYAIIGLAVIIMAWAIVYFVISALVDPYQTGSSPTYSTEVYEP